MLSYFVIFITKFTFILGGFTSKNSYSKNDRRVSVECENESGEMYESCEEESLDGSSEISDSCEEETFDEAYASLLDENLKKNEEDEIVMENEINLESVFRKSSWNLKPPFKGVQKKQKME